MCHFWHTLCKHCLFLLGWPFRKNIISGWKRVLSGTIFQYLYILHSRWVNLFVGMCTAGTTVVIASMSETERKPTCILDWINSPHYIREESNFNFRHVRLCDLDIPRENYLQTLETLIRCRIMGQTWNATEGQVVFLWVLRFLFVCVEVLQPSQPNGVMSSAVSLPNHTFTGQA